MSRIACRHRFTLNIAAITSLIVATYFINSASLASAAALPWSHVEVNNNLGLSSLTPVPVGQSGNWRLLFGDDFDGVSLDTNKWVTNYWWKDHWWKDSGSTNEGTGELEWYQADDIIVNA